MLVVVDGVMCCVIRLCVRVCVVAVLCWCVVLDVGCAVWRVGVLGLFGG